MKRPIKYFVARHDLQSFTCWPGAVWRTAETEFPRGLKKMRVGDYWVAFAYINTETQFEPIRQVVGFYRCVSIPKRRILIPSRARKLNPKVKYAWTLLGKPVGKALSFPVTVPPINEMLKTTKFGGQTLTPISKKQFNEIRHVVRDRKLKPSEIPVFGRDPRNEQEVVAILVAAHQQLGIERIERIRTGFPDVRVKLKGRRDPVHIEVETYSRSFILHGHQTQVRAKKFISKLLADERLPVLLACWYDNDRDGSAARHVHRIFDLRDLLQNGGKITY